MPNPTDIRLAIASQPTLDQSLSALIRAITSRINQPVTDTGPDSAQALARAMADEPKAWSDAVLANTRAAAESATMALPVPVAVSGDIKARMAAQPTVAQAVALFVQHAASALAAHADGKPGPARSLADDVAGDCGWSWIEAALANTLATPPAATLAPVPAHVEAALALPGTDAPADEADQRKAAPPRKS